MKRLFRLLLVWCEKSTANTPTTIHDVDIVFWYGEEATFKALLAASPNMDTLSAVFGIEDTPLRRNSAVLVRGQQQADTREGLIQTLKDASQPYNLLVHIWLMIPVPSGGVAYCSDLYQFTSLLPVLDLDVSFNEQLQMLLAELQRHHPTITGDQCSYKIHTKIIDPSRNKAILEAALQELEATS